jgi:hypothetical protein
MGRTHSVVRDSVIGRTFCYPPFASVVSLVCISISRDAKDGAPTVWWGTENRDTNNQLGSFNISSYPVLIRY